MIRSTFEPYDAAVSRQLADLHVDHAIAVLLDDGGLVVGYTMCHPAGPKGDRLACRCKVTSASAR